MDELTETTVDAVETPMPPLMDAEFHHPVPLDNLPSSHTVNDPLDENRSGVHTLDSMMDVPHTVIYELGRRPITIGELLNLGPGSIVDLAGISVNSIDILVDQHPIARGEITAEHEHYGVSFEEMLVRHQRDDE